MPIIQEFCASILSEVLNHWKTGAKFLKKYTKNNTKTAENPDIELHIFLILSLGKQGKNAKKNTKIGTKTADNQIILGVGGGAQFFFSEFFYPSGKKMDKVQFINFLMDNYRWITF